MTQTTITRRLAFDAGHRVVGHEGKCANLHGHRYVADIVVTAKGLDTLGRVIDFSVVKRLVGGWVDEQWDHNMLLNSLDPLFEVITEAGATGSRNPIRRSFGPKIPYTFNAENPTAEVIAKELFRKSVELLEGSKISVVSVRIWETPNCWADFSADPTGL